MELFLFPLLLMAILLASFWYHDMHTRLQVAYVKPQKTQPLTPPLMR